MTHLIIKRIAFGAIAAVVLALTQSAHAEPAPPPPAPLAERIVGVAYTTWHTSTAWNNTWGTPTLGFYKSDDRAVIRQHAKWMADAGVDFAWVDWSNDIKYLRDPKKANVTFDMIEGATTAMFDEYAKMRDAGERTPNVSIFAGVTGSPEAAADGRLKAKVDQIHREYLENPRFAPLVQTYLGKPLLVIYVNTPSPFQKGTPDFSDDRFAIRWMTGYVTQQPALRDGSWSKLGYWSWEDRGEQTYTIFQGHPESMVVVASWREDKGNPAKPGSAIPAGERDDGKTFLKQWARARAIGPRVVTVVSWNEWHRGEQPTTQVSKDIEPSKEFGMQYVELLKQQIALFKAGK